MFAINGNNHMDCIYGHSVVFIAVNNLVNLMVNNSDPLFFLQSFCE